MLGPCAFGGPYEVSWRGPAVPTAIWGWRFRSGSAHWDLELADAERFITSKGAHGPALLARLFKVLAADFALSIASSWALQWYGLSTCLVSSKDMQGVANIASPGQMLRMAAAILDTGSHLRHTGIVHRRSCRPLAHGRQSHDKM
eukprot:s863_g42.t1